MTGLMMKYFALKPSARGWHGEACRAALEAYENIARQNGQTQFAEDLRLWRAECKAKVDAPDEKLAEIADACSQTRTFGWLTDNGYPTSGMSQKEGFTTFQLAPILEAYRKFRASAKDTPQQYYSRVWVKEHGSDPRGDWPFRFAEAYAAYLNFTGGTLTITE